VATDVGWIQIGVKAMAFMMPCPVQLFAIGKLDDAKRWLSESLGSIHIHSEGGFIKVRLLGRLDPSAYDGVNEEIDNVMSHTEHVRLVLDLREFDGWSGLSALGMNSKGDDGPARTRTWDQGIMSTLLPSKSDG
jgi:hypothetical protein